MPPVLREFKRSSEFRDSQLFIIATEGQKTEHKYFNDFYSYPLFRNPRIYIHVIRRIKSASSPVHILAELDKIKSEYKWRQDDELWMVVDKDAWKAKHLSTVARLCNQKNYFLAVSNPCFELWLLLHVKDIPKCSPSDQKLHTKKQYLIAELKRILRGYNKNNPDTDKLFPTIRLAIDRARILDTNPLDRWPQTLGTRVYLLTSKLLTLCPKCPHQ